MDGNKNKQFQAQPRIDFGKEEAGVRTRDITSKIGPSETSSTYAYTSNKRSQNRQKVYDVNLPFSKNNAGPTSPYLAHKKPQSSANGGGGNTTDLKMHQQTENSSNGFSKSHA